MSKNQKRKIILFDSHAIIHRAYHALPDFASSKGEPTGALYGLSSMLMAIINEFKPDFKYKQDEEVILLKNILKNLCKYTPYPDKQLDKSWHNAKAKLNLNFDYDKRNQYDELNYNDEMSYSITVREKTLPQSHTISRDPITNQYHIELESKQEQINQLEHKLENKI